MASDKSQYNQALRKWDYLHDLGRFSAPNEHGAVAILCSDHEVGEEDDGVQSAAFLQEAEEIATELAMMGIDTQLFPAYSQDDAAYVLTEQAFSTVITIGNGNLSESYAENGYSFDWQFVADYADHLKTGRFVQRHCGQAIREMSVPLGTFAMSRHSDVFAAHNVTLPTKISDEFEREIKRLHTFPRLGYRALKSLFPKIEIDKEEVVYVDMSDLPQFAVDE